jgi:hypothetical protein
VKSLNSDSLEPRNDGLTIMQGDQALARLAESEEAAAKFNLESFEHLFANWESEMAHTLAMQRLQRLMTEVESAKLIPAAAGADDALVDVAAELPPLLSSLGGASTELVAISTVESLIAFSLEAHSLLRSIAIYFNLNHRMFHIEDTAALRGKSLRLHQRSDAAGIVHRDLRQFQYFVTVLDGTLIPEVRAQRLLRTPAMLLDTQVAARKYFAIFRETLANFQKNFLEGEAVEEGMVADFFAKVDQSAKVSLAAERNGAWNVIDGYQGRCEKRLRANPQYPCICARCR